MNAVLVRIIDAVPVNGRYSARAVRLTIDGMGFPTFIDAANVRVCRVPGPNALDNLRAGSFYQAIELATSSGVRAAVVL